jgi:hypothetical protein
MQVIDYSGLTPYQQQELYFIQGMKQDIKRKSNHDTCVVWFKVALGTGVTAGDQAKSLMFTMQCAEKAGIDLNTVNWGIPRQYQ